MKKNKFYCHTTPIFLGDVDIKRVLVSERFLLVKRNYTYIIGYLYDNHTVKPLHIMLPKTGTYVKIYNGQTQWMYFLIEDDDLLKKYNTIWNKVSVDIKNEFDSKTVYNKKYLKTKIKVHGNEVADFYNEKIPKLDSNHTCLAVITFNYDLNKGSSYYLKVFLKGCKNIEKKVVRYTHDSLSDSSDESDEE